MTIPVSTSRWTNTEVVDDASAEGDAEADEAPPESARVPKGASDLEDTLYRMVIRDAEFEIPTAPGEPARLRLTYKRGTCPNRDWRRQLIAMVCIADPAKGWFGHLSSFSSDHRILYISHGIQHPREREICIEVTQRVKPRVASLFLGMYVKSGNLFLREFRFSTGTH